MRGGVGVGYGGDVEGEEMVVKEEEIWRWI